MEIARAEPRVYRFSGQQLGAGSAPAMPPLPDTTCDPAQCEADERADDGGLHHYPDEVEETARRVEATNAANDEQPLLRAAGERRQDAGSDRGACGEVVPTGLVVRLGSARSAQHGDHAGKSTPVRRTVASQSRCRCSGSRAGRGTGTVRPPNVTQQPPARVAAVAAATTA